MSFLSFSFLLVPGSPDKVEITCGKLHKPDETRDENFGNDNDSEWRIIDETIAND